MTRSLTSLLARPLVALTAAAALPPLPALAAGGPGSADEAAGVLCLVAVAAVVLGAVLQLYRERQRSRPLPAGLLELRFNEVARLHQACAEASVELDLLRSSLQEHELTLEVRAALDELSACVGEAHLPCGVADEAMIECDALYEPWAGKTREALQRFRGRLAVLEQQELPRAMRIHLARSELTRVYALFDEALAELPSLLPANQRARARLPLGVTNPLDLATSALAEGKPDACLVQASLALRHLDFEMGRLRRAAGMAPPLPFPTMDEQLRARREQFMRLEQEIQQLWQHRTALLEAAQNQIDQAMLAYERLPADVQAGEAANLQGLRCKIAEIRLQLINRYVDAPQGVRALESHAGWLAHRWQAGRPPQPSRAPAPPPHVIRDFGLGRWAGLAFG